MTTLSKAEILERFDKFASLVREAKFDGIKPEMNWWLVNPNKCSEEVERDFNQNFVTILDQLDIPIADMYRHFKRYWAGDMGENSFQKILRQRKVGDCVFITVRAQDLADGNTSPVGGDDSNIVQRSKNRSIGSSWK